MKTIILIIAMLTAWASIFAQKKMTTSGTIIFDATTTLDPLPKAENKTVIVAIDLSNGALAFEVPVKNFSFGNPTMQQHFNSPGWLDSEKYPTAAFKGTIINPGAIDFTKDGSYDADVTGDLTIHGVTRPVKISGKIAVSGKAVIASADFTIKLADYGIDSPPVGAGKVSREPRVSVLAEMQ